MSSRYGFPSTSDFRKSITNLEQNMPPGRRRSSDFSALRRKSFDQGPDRRLSNALDSEQPPQPTKPKHFNAGLAQDITDTLSHHNAVAATVAIKQKFGTGAILAAKRLAKKAARRTRIRRLWSWAIDKVLRMIRATNVFSTNANKYKDTEAIKLASLKSKMVDLGFSLDTYKVQTHAGGSIRVMNALNKLPENRNEQDLKVLENYYYVLSGELEVIKEIDSQLVWVGNMKTGNTFGDLALLLETKKRTATIVSTKDTELLWLTQDDFSEVLQDETIRELKEREELIGANPFFAQLGTEAVKNLALTSKLFDVQADTMILTEGTVVPWVYLVCEGDLKLLRAMTFTKVKEWGRQDKYTLHPYPLPPEVEAPHGSEKVTKLLCVSKITDGAIYGAVQSLVASGTPNQIATIGSVGIDFTKGSLSAFSLVSATRLKYIQVGKHALSKELVHFPVLVKQMAVEHVALQQHQQDWNKIQRLYLDR
ncbi:hypothetical protein HDU99_001104, partial [Rhizoclosmatium hyalinum]